MGGFDTGGAANNSSGVLTGALTDNPTIFGITCTGLGGSVTSYASVTVLQPYATISASPTRVTSGTNSTITWTAGQVRSCTITGPGISRTDYAETPTSQSVAITGKSTFTIRCLTNGEDKVGTATVNVGALFKEF